MAVLKSTVIIALCLVSLFVIWTQLNNKTKPEKQPQFSTRQAVKAEPSTSLLRIEALETELSQTQNILHQFEQRLFQLEQEPLKRSLPDQQQEESVTATIQTRQKEPEAIPESLPDRLLASGIPFDTIERIQQLVAKNRLAQLELRNQATRENWIDTPDYFEKAEELSNTAQSLREELGDSDYDRYLYAAGRPNRVIVTEVFTGSAAADAGILPQDIIIGYASELIFSMSDLQQATVEGIAGELVLLDIFRDNSPVSISVPRGPLGIAMTMIRKPAQ